MIYKIGEEIGFNSDFEIELAFSGDKLLVKQGDKGFLDSKGMIHYTTGQARGKIQKIKVPTYIGTFRFLTKVKKNIRIILSSDVFDGGRDSINKILVSPPAFECF